MAAAIIPIVTALPDIIGLIAGLVHRFAPAAEQKFGAGTGPVKFASVFEQVVTTLQSAAQAGQIPKTLPDDATIQTIIQAVVSSMQLSGALTNTPPPQPIPPPPQAVTLSPGQSVTVAAK